MSDFRFEGDAQYGDNRLPIVPKSFYRAELRYDHGPWFVAPSLEWAMSRAFVDFRNTQTTPSYAVWSLNAGWAVTQRASLFLDLRNLADKSYVTNAQPVIAGGPTVAALWPADGRSINAGLTVDF